MFLDYSKIEFDSNGNPEFPELQLMTLSNDIIGVLSGVSDLRFNIKFSEPSEISFSIPKQLYGCENPTYDCVTGHKIVYTKNYGVYMIMNPKTEYDGMSEVKRVQGYSIEKTLDSKRFFIEEGTFNFWNPVSPDDTILGRILEIATGWSVGYVSPELIGKYRTFDSSDDYLLSFVYNKAPDKYRCAFVFDPYAMTISAYSIDDEMPTLPIYLDFDNLVKNVTVSEISDELVTAIRPYGADGLDIRNINPIGTNWMYDLSYFIENGDIDGELANKWVEWKKEILNNQATYRGLNALRASSTAKLLAERAALVDLNGELNVLVGNQSVVIQALAVCKNDDEKIELQGILDETNLRIDNKKTEIQNKEAVIESLESEINSDDASSYGGRIKEIVDRLAFNSYFTNEEKDVLSKYFIEQDVTESTFVATDIDTSVSGDSYNIDTGSINISDSNILKVDFSADFSSHMFVISGGKFYVDGPNSIEGDIIRGTVEIKDTGSYVMSVYAGSMLVGDKSATGGMVTVTGSMSNLSSDMRDVPLTDDGATTTEGSQIHFDIESSSLFLTANVNEFQKYSVQMELFDYFTGVLSDVATPTYEFSVDSANFIFAKEFAPFRNRLELGKAVYLMLNEGQVIKPIMIELELSFEDRSKFSLVFSNRFKRHDGVNVLKGMIEKSYSTSRSFDANKHIYNKASEQASSVSTFMQSSMDAAKNSIIAASNQSVVIDGTGINVGVNSNNQIRIVDSMIAMTNDGWNTAKVGIGLFASPEIGEYWGINTEVLGGKIAITENLFVESVGDDGSVQFRVDASGAWLNNSTFVLQKNNGKIIVDPKYGIVAGSGNLFSTNGTSVTPSFINGDGSIKFDNDGMPENSSFYLDIRDGSAYFKGTLNATSGSIGGFNIDSDYLHTGSAGNFVALNGSGSNEHSLYALWAGNQRPTNAPFWVKKNGDFHAANGTFGGTLNAAKISGNLIADENVGGWLVGCGINVGDGNFHVDEYGNVEINGNVEMTGSGTINADTIELGSSYGGFCCQEGSDGVSTTFGAKMYGSDQRFYFIATNAGVRMQSANHSITITNGRITADEEIAIGSDRRIKNSISYEMDKYLDFFMNLKPSFYRLNNGSSNRYHVGFIAQDIESAMIDAGLSTADFAGLVQSSGVNDAHEEYIDQYYLRYTDFIALNTAMVQRSLLKIDELNQKIFNLEHKENNDENRNY